ncbi:MAG: hypothetical protein CMM73_05185 [Rhodospirillaceae bacterium]|nr:hypothetical protein [Rhodospirillaceae bacterium]
MGKAMENEIGPYRQNHISGKWVDAGAGRLGVEDFGTCTALAEIALADEADINVAVAATLNYHASRVLTVMR